MHGPNPETRYPLPDAERVVFLKNFITRPELAWWDWLVERISRHLKAIRGADLGALRAAVLEP